MIKSIGEIVSPWKIPPLMFTFCNTWLFAVRIVFHFSMLSNGSFLTLSANRTSSTACFSHEFSTISYIILCIINPVHCKAFTFFPTILQNSFIYQQFIFCPSWLFPVNFCSLGRNMFWRRWSGLFSAKITVNNFHISGRHANGLWLLLTFLFLAFFMMSTVLPIVKHSVAIYQ